MSGVAAGRCAYLRRASGQRPHAQRPVAHSWGQRQVTGEGGGGGVRGTTAAARAQRQALLLLMLLLLHPPLFTPPIHPPPAPFSAVTANAAAAAAAGAEPVLALSAFRDRRASLLLATPAAGHAGRKPRPGPARGGGGSQGTALTWQVVPMCVGQTCLARGGWWAGS